MNTSSLRALRVVLPWLAFAAVLGIVQLLLHASGASDYQRLILDAAELADEIGALDGLVTSVGVALLAGATCVTWFAASLLDTDAPARPMLLAVGALAALLAVDDRVRGHEGLSNVTGLPEVVFLAVFPLAVVVIVAVWRQHLLEHWPLLALFVVGFGVSLALDTIVEEILDLDFPGATFLEENAKLVGIIGMLGLSVSLARASLRPAAPDGA